jgi:cytochrome c-type biogenesis protein CcmH/NrfF
MDWIAETFSLIFGGLNSLLVGLLRLGLVALSIVVIVVGIRVFFKDPKKGTLYILSWIAVIVILVGGWIIGVYSRNNLKTRCRVLHERSSHLRCLGLNGGYTQPSFQMLVS